MELRAWGGRDLSPINANDLDRLVNALGLVDANPGRQIRRDARGWKESEVQLHRLLVAAIRPAFQSQIVLATGIVNSTCQAAVLLGDDLVGPVMIDSAALDTVTSAWPAPGTWGDGWITVDGTGFDLMLSSLGASTRLQFTSGSKMDFLAASIGALLRTIAELTDAPSLRAWLSDTTSF
jgi:hypothetical protein